MQKTNSRPRKITQYYNPIQGKPAPIELSGLFLFSPSSEVKISGSSFSGLFADMGEASLYKMYDQTMKGKRQPGPELISKISAILPTQYPIAEDLNAAINGDELAQTRMDQIGLWESYLIGISNGDEQMLSPRDAFILSVERACAEPAYLVSQGKISEAAKLLLKNPLMRNYFWPEAVPIFNSKSDAKQLLPLQLSIAHEVFLSGLAAMDAGLETPDSQLLDVLPHPQKPGCNPTKLFFIWLKSQIGAKSIQSILDDKRAKDLKIDLVTLKRWSSGRHHPDIAWLTPVVHAFFEEAVHQRVWVRYLGSRYLNFIGYIAQLFSDATHNLNEKEMGESVAPWPNLPFGHKSFESWCQARYIYWYDHHKSLNV